MSNVSYDLDNSGGLMPLIRALIKPPDDDSNGSKQKKPQHPYYKRPGKGHNHDCCDACGEGGDLICCDKCPASFHLGCHDPPLEENDIPAGQWLCKECRSVETEMGSSTKSSRAQSPVDKETEKKRSLRTRTTSSSVPKKKVNDEPKPEVIKPEEPEKIEEEKELSPLEVLVKAARIMNPTQFELPPEMRVPCPFPGTEKENSATGNATVITVDSSGCVPLPAKTCFVCTETCKYAALIQCDYCPLLFHQDCLNPPMTALPTGRWMCPNHVEQCIDWKMVNSISATERIALWDKFTGPVDQHAIKIDFIRHARNKCPPFRLKVPVGVVGRVVVPAMVRHHYLHPAPLLPTRRDYVRCANVLKQLQYAGTYTEDDDPSGKKHQICMNLDCPKYTDSGHCPHELQPTGDSKNPGHTADASMTELEQDLKLIQGDMEIEENGDLEHMDQITNKVIRKRKLHAQTHTPAKKVQIEANIQKLGIKVEGRDAEEMLATAEQQLGKLDDRLVKLLAWQRLQQVLSGELSSGSYSHVGLSPLAIRTASSGCVVPPHILSAEEARHIATAVWGATPDRQAAVVHPPLTDVTAKAAVAPVGVTADGVVSLIDTPVPMRLSRLSVGTDSGCDVILTRFGHCRHVSPLHAIIFYDEVSRQFELLNYSEWGTCIDGVMYAADLQDTEPKHNNTRIKKNGDPPGRMYVCGAPPCGCPPRPAAPPSGAWEGAALLTHGALLTVGCLQLVFTVTPHHTLTDTH